MCNSRENRKPVTWLVAGALLLMTALPATASADGNSDQWQYEALVYLWGAGLKGSAASGADLDITFNDVMDSLDLGFMGTFGARKGKWSLLVDAMYLNVSDSDGGSETIPVLDGGLEVTRKVDVDVETKSWITSFGAGYTVVNNERVALDLVGGARYLWLDIDLKLDLTHEGERLQTSKQVKVSESESFWDGIVGVRGTYIINNNWFMPYYADVGTGESDLTWQAMVGVGYKFKWGDVLLAYRYLDYDFKSGFAMEDLSVSGPALGAKFSF